METKEVKELLDKLGVTSDSDKESFRNMYNYVFDPIFKMSPFEQGSSTPHNNDQLGTTTTEPEVRAFQVVLRKHFRFPTFPNLAAAVERAEAEFAKAVAVTKRSASRSSQMTADELKTFEAKLWTQIHLQKKWITEVDDYGRRHKVQESAREDAVEDFKLHLSDKFSFDLIKFYEEVDIRSFSKGLETKIVDEFSKEIYQKFEDKTEIHDWCVDLRKECFQLVTDATQKNRKNRETWNLICGIAASNFKEMMEPFLKTHQFGKKDGLDTFCDKIKTKCEDKHGLTKFVTKPSLLKSAWDAKIDQEYGKLREKWKAEGDSRIESFLNTVKAEGQTAFKKEFNFELERGELERMFSQVPQIARLNLEKAAAKSTPVEDNLIDDIEDRESGRRGGDDGSSISNEEGEGDMVESSSSTSKSSKSVIGVSDMYSDNHYRLVFPANTRLPSEEFRGTFQTLRPYQTTAHVAIYEHESASLGTIRRIGIIRWTNIPPKHNCVALYYTMKLDALGLLHVEWKVGGSEKKQTAQFKTLTWKGTESVAASQGHRSGSKNKRSKVSGLSQEEVDASSNKKAKIQKKTN